MVHHGNFPSDELELCDWQYTIRHTRVESFRKGDLVFFKSNPELKQRVVAMNPISNRIAIRVIGKKDIYWTAPECILQLCFASLQTYRDSNVHLCFN